ncbi:MAG: O-antigen ligase family protein [Synergistaceae bacterium]|nr:O-antigen ligase family protein [Synergistaceae bacterium]MBR0250040.1 O-antigen ligase family protein [Synergistaceae bacterium]
MKKDKARKIAAAEKFIQLPLVPVWLLLPLWLVSLSIPNLIYSGINFADTLHIIKWTVTGVPVAIAVFIAGFRLMRYGKDRIAFRTDMFAVIWAVILAYTAVQPLWVKIWSPTGYTLEMVCFVTVFAFYVLTAASFPDWGLRPVLLLGNLNAAINVMFAELQIRRINDLSFLKGTWLADIRKISNIILPTPGNYIGNTAQQNMFGLWTAVAVLGAVYLFVYDAWKNDSQEHGRKIWLPSLCIAGAVLCIRFAVTQSDIYLAVMAGLLVLGAFILAFRFGNDKHVYYSVIISLLASVNFWGLMNSTSRSGTLALILGLLVMLIIAAWKFNRNYVIRFAAILLVLASVFWASLYSPRSGKIVNKTVDILQHAENIGNRRGIWMTSYSMLLEHPQGVGIGQYKWHYLEAQREGFKRVKDDWYTWQYTHWAHNEFLQFFCEGGYIGGILLLLMWLIWFIPAFKGLMKKERMSININAVWALGLISLITFCAVFTRPFHRIENMVWITLAFAISNREFFDSKRVFEILKGNTLREFAGFACIAASIAGCVYISSGIYGNYILRKALSSQNANEQMYLLEEADKHPIVREDTQRNIGYHYMQLGEMTNDPEMLAKGFNILLEQFRREPHSEDINRLLEFAQKYQIENVIRELSSYFRPGTYHLERRPHKNSNGDTVNALLMVRGPGSDDE